MGVSRRWIFPALAAVAGTLLYRARRRGTLDRALADVQASGMPSAGTYDRVTTPVMGRLHWRIAAEIGALAPEGRVLDVGCGPGRIAVRLAKVAPAARVVGIDVLPDMIDRASAHAVRAGVADRTEFRVADVAALPFPDDSFDVAISTFSLHHWPDPKVGLAEVYRVLKPGGVALIYEPADWILAIERHAVPLADLIVASPFSRGAVEVYSRLGPLPLVRRAEMKRVR